MYMTVSPASPKRRPDLAARNRAGHEHPIFPQGEVAGIKHCTACCKDKPLDEFGRDSSVADGKRAQCKRCTANAAQSRYRKAGGREKQRARRAALAAERYVELAQFKDVPCADCGGRYPMVCMDFDHVRGEKINSISVMVRDGSSWEAILAEVEKCDVVCANCHRVRSAARGGWASPFEIRGV